MALVPYPPIPAPVTATYVPANTVKTIDIVNTAFTLAGRKAIGNPLDGEELAWGMTLLKGMINSWQADGLFIPFVTEAVATVSGSPVAIGTGQTVNVPRPRFVRDTSFFRVTNVDVPVHWLNEKEFNQLQTKTISSQYPLYGYYDAAIPVGKLYFWPAPQNVELHLILDAELPAFSDFNITDYAIDTGYSEAIYLTLACKACLGIKEIPADLERNANKAVSKIRRNNGKVPVVNLPYQIGSKHKASWEDFLIS